MMKKHIFISSVQSEFEEERKRLAEYIRQDALFSRYFEPFLFEELPAQDVSAQVAYLEQAAKSEVYILLVGENYGYQDAEEALSWVLDEREKIRDKKTDKDYDER